MIWTKVSIILLICTLEVFPRSLAREPEVLHFDEVDYPEEVDVPLRKHHMKVLLVEDIPSDSFDAAPKVKVHHCPEGQLMDHRGRCRQIW